MTENEGQEQPGERLDKESQLTGVESRDLPAVFRGVFWDDGWEFDAPCVMYEPFQRYSYGGNSGEFDSMVERECIAIAIGETSKTKFSAGELKEFERRGWSIQGFRRRKSAWHVEIAVQWRHEDDELEFAIVNRREQWGPFKAATEATNQHAALSGTTVPATPEG